MSDIKHTLDDPASAVRAHLSLVKTTTVRKVIKAGAVKRVSKDSCEITKRYVLALMRRLVGKALFVMKKMERITLTEEHIKIALLLEWEQNEHAIRVIEVLELIYALQKKLKSKEKGGAEEKIEDIDKKKPRKTPRRTPGRTPRRTPGRTPGRERPRPNRKKSKLNQAILNSTELQALGVTGRVPLSSMKTLWKEQTDEQVFFSDPRISKRALFAMRSIFEVFITNVAKSSSRYLNGRATISLNDVKLYLTRNVSPDMVHIVEQRALYSFGV